MISVLCSPILALQSVRWAQECKKYTQAWAYLLSYCYEGVTELEPDKHAGCSGMLQAVKEKPMALPSEVDDVLHDIISTHQEAVVLWILEQGRIPTWKSFESGRAQHALISMTNCYELVDKARKQRGNLIAQARAVRAAAREAKAKRTKKMRKTKRQEKAPKSSSLGFSAGGARCVRADCCDASLIIFL